MLTTNKCPSCGAAGLSVFYELEDLPVHSVRLLPTREEALSYPRGTMALGFCPACGFIANVAFDPSLHEYSSRYEATQAFSPTFNAFARRQAIRLIDRYDLHGKDIIEIGCGQGEFLTLLCELGDNRGVGFDPAYVEGRIESQVKDQIIFVKDFYSEKYADAHGDFVCCKMTLEHIQDTAGFVRMVRRSLGDRGDTIVFFQVPDVTRILREVAFWDIYYEHCSYFSPGSLARLFRRCGFDVVRLATEYDGQYLMIEARPGGGTDGEGFASEDAPEDVGRDVGEFTRVCAERLEAWRRDLKRITRTGQRVVIWGGGSKGVAFLTTLNVRDEIAYAVDINPHKHGTFMAGTGQEIVAPEFLGEYRPDMVIVMNPIYCAEIRRELDRMGVEAELRPV
jgi:SAM-dependent methyltransferase